MEHWRPRRAFQHGLANRWVGNGGMLALGSLFVRLLFAPGAALGTAWYCEQNGVGLLHATGASFAVAAIAGWLALDFAMWLQHWVQHRSSLLWRSHRVHHTDLDVDFSTSLRFHPFEAAWTTLARVLTVGLLGVPVVVALVYEVSLSVVSTLSHSNLDVPERVDAWLRRVIVTSDVHRVHHSAAAERESNYGSVLTAWDRMLGTYVAQPEKGHRDMELGLPEHRDAASLHLPALLWMPFRANPGPAPPRAR
jgi:sterol desaturase/sphingolipid hydroxylase (fatty acid hydroxylase superfamily)